MKCTSSPVKLSCIITSHNWQQVHNYIEQAKLCGIKRIAFRYIYGDKERFPLFSELLPFRFHCHNPVYLINNIEITHWVFEEYSGKSLNLFSDGTLSDKYLLAEAAPSTSSSLCGSSEPSKVDNRM